MRRAFHQLAASFVMAMVTSAIGCVFEARAADAQSDPRPYPATTTIINENEHSLFVVSCAPLTVCTIFLPLGEVPNPARPIVVGDSARWNYDVNTAGGRWYVSVKPSADHLEETLQINSNRAAHVIRLRSHGYVSTVTYAFPDPIPLTGPSPVPSPSPKPLIAAQYAVSGEGSFRPAAVTTDGERTYITLYAGAIQPTVFGIDSSGQEYPLHVVPPRYVGDYVLTIDGIPDHFIMASGPGKHDERVDVRRIK